MSEQKSPHKKEPHTDIHFTFPLLKEPLLKRMSKEQIRSLSLYQLLSFYAAPDRHLEIKTQTNESEEAKKKQLPEPLAQTSENTPNFHKMISELKTQFPAQSLDDFVSISTSKKAKPSTKELFAESVNKFNKSREYFLQEWAKPYSRFIPRLQEIQSNLKN
ncbi:hypothetical protein M0811_09225 [Anaeramoeba ignava]|uniref:Uncharacterized protein n=1 Tax=Anaeramoeba ignava TaxID=1746090 RepID=A0A9Q0LGQ2_ANAIG|nr:hypothetical protein M0811_09225 [Anaeramoeba ignava]